MYNIDWFISNIEEGMSCNTLEGKILIIVNTEILLSNFTDSTGSARDVELGIMFNLDYSVFEKHRRLRNELVHFNSNSNYVNLMYNYSKDSTGKKIFLEFNYSSVIDTINNRLYNILKNMK